MGHLKVDLARMVTEYGGGASTIENSNVVYPPDMTSLEVVLAPGGGGGGGRRLTNLSWPIPETATGTWVKPPSFPRSEIDVIGTTRHE